MPVDPRYAYNPEYGGANYSQVAAPGQAFYMPPGVQPGMFPQMGGGMPAPSNLSYMGTGQKGTPWGVTTPQQVAQQSAYEAAHPSGPTQLLSGATPSQAPTQQSPDRTPMMVGGFDISGLSPEQQQQFRNAYGSPGGQTPPPEYAGPQMPQYGTPPAGYLNPAQGMDLQGQPYGLNPWHYLQDQPSMSLAQQLGGSAVQVSTPPGSPYGLPPQNQLVFDQAPNTMFNAGLVQQRYDRAGQPGDYSLDFANKMMQDEIAYNEANRMPSLQERQGGVRPTIFGTWPGVDGSQLRSLTGQNFGATMTPNAPMFGSFQGMKPTASFGSVAPGIMGTSSYGPQQGQGGSLPFSGGTGTGTTPGTGGSGGSLPTPGLGGSGTGATGGGTNPFGSGTGAGGFGGSNPWAGFRHGGGGSSSGGGNIFQPGPGLNLGGGGFSPQNPFGSGGGANSSMFGQGPQIDMAMGPNGVFQTMPLQMATIGQGQQAPNPFNPSMSSPLQGFAANGRQASNVGNNLGGWQGFQTAALPGNAMVNIGDRQRYNAGPDVDYYRSLVQGGGSPIDQTPAWEAMKIAQQRNIDRYAADMEEQFNVSGNRFSTAFGNAAVDFRSQAAKDQNAQLLAAQAQALENAKGRQYQGAQALGGLAYQDAWKQGDLDAQQTDARIRGAQVNQAPWMLQQQIGAQMANADLNRRSMMDDLGFRSQEAALGRQFGAAQQLGQMDLQAGMQANQLNAQGEMQGQDILSRYALANLGLMGQGGMQAQQLGANSYNNEMARAMQAAMAAAGGSDQAAAMMAQFGAQGANALLGSSMAGAQGLFGAENQGAMSLWDAANRAAQGMYGGQLSMLPQQMQYDLALRQMGLGGASQLSNLWQQNLGVGSQLGNQQFGMDAWNLNRVYEEWLRTQPENNPMIPYLYSAATAQPAVMTPMFRPSGFSQIAGAVGGLAQGAGALMGGMYGTQGIYR